MSMRESPKVEAVRWLRHRQAVDRLAYLRGLRGLTRTMTQQQIAQALDLTQPSVNSALKTAAKVAEVPEGFSGASPYEIAQRYAVGELTREQVIAELTRWPYDPSPTSDGYDALIVDEPGTHTVEELARALDDGLIDEGLYDELGEAHRTNA